MHSSQEITICNFCPERRNKFMRLSMNNLTNKYFVNFFFYFAKPINEIILKVPHLLSVIEYYENLTWDDNQEYFSRYFNSGNGKEQLKLLTGKGKPDFRVTENRVLNKVQKVLERHTLLSQKTKLSQSPNSNLQETFRPTFVLQETAKIMQKRDKKIKNMGKERVSSQKKEGKVYETLLKGLESLLQEKKEVNEFKLTAKSNKPKPTEEDDSLKADFESFLRHNEKLITKEHNIGSKVKPVNRNQLIMDLVKELEGKSYKKTNHKKAKSNEKKPTVCKSGAMTERSHKAKKTSIDKEHEKGIVQAVKNLSKMSDFKKIQLNDFKLSHFISPFANKMKSSGAKTTRDTKKTKERISSAGEKSNKFPSKNSGIATRIILSKVQNFRPDGNMSKSGENSKSVNRPITERNLSCNRNIDDIYGFLTTRKNQKSSNTFKSQKANILKAKAKELLQLSKASKQKVKNSPDQPCKLEVEPKNTVGPSINCKFNFKLDLRGIKRDFIN